MRCSDKQHARFLPHILYVRELQRIGGEHKSARSLKWHKQTNKQPSPASQLFATRVVWWWWWASVRNKAKRKSTNSDRMIRIAKCLFSVIITGLHRGDEWRFAWCIWQSVRIAFSGQVHHGDFQWLVGLCACIVGLFISVTIRVAETNASVCTPRRSALYCAVLCIRIAVRHPAAAGVSKLYILCALRCLRRTRTEIGRHTIWIGNHETTGDMRVRPCRVHWRRMPLVGVSSARRWVVCRIDNWFYFQMCVFIVVAVITAVVVDSVCGSGMDRFGETKFARTCVKVCVRSFACCCALAAVFAFWWW